MVAVAAQLILYGDLSVDGFFDEADRLGISTESLADAETYGKVLMEFLTRIRTQAALEAAGELSLNITPEQAEKIARHSLVPAVTLIGVPLSPEEQKLAEELYYHAVKEAMAKHGETVPDATARRTARHMVRTGQRGSGSLQRRLRAAGCLPQVLSLTAVAIALAAALAAYAAG